MFILLKQILLLVLITSCSLKIEAQDNNSSNLGSLEGKVTNVLGFPIPEIQIILESQYGLFEIITDKNGEFGIGLERGIYEIRTKEWKGKLPYNNKEPFFFADCLSYFRQSYRSPIKLAPSSKNKLNFVLIESGCLDWNKELNIGQFEIVSHGDLIGKRQNDFISIVNSQMKIGIEFEKRTEKNNLVIYESNIIRETTPKFEKTRQGVIISYNFQTVYTKKAIYDRKLNVVTISGDVVFENNGKVLYPKKMKIKIDGNKVSFVEIP